MEKFKELGWRNILIISAAVEAVLGIIGIIAGSTVVGVIMLILQVAYIAFVIFALCGEDNKSSINDKYRKLFMNLPIGFAQAKVISDTAGNVIGYTMVDANEKFGNYFNLDPQDYQDRILGDSKIEVLQDINAWFNAYNNSGTKKGDLMDVEITMEKLGKVFNTVMYKSESDYVNMVVIDVTEQKETETKLSKAI